MQLKEEFIDDSENSRLLRKQADDIDRFTLQVPPQPLHLALHLALHLQLRNHVI
jgi:hypothetical protein